jgi:hypothetical protein
MLDFSGTQSEADTPIYDFYELVGFSVHQARSEKS